MQFKKDFQYALISRFLPPLLGWYERNKRDLPWRRDREPYHVWLSEIMLQQTRVEAVKGYYARFLAELRTFRPSPRATPTGCTSSGRASATIPACATCKRPRSRSSRTMAARSRRTMTRSAPCPASATIPPGAICSICFGQPTPAVDGNVPPRRLPPDRGRAPRHTARGQKDYTAALAEIYPAGQCAEATQALMELGATVCAPNGAPHCDLCPVAAFCQSREGERWRTIPVKDAKKPRRAEQKTVFL